MDLKYGFHEIEDIIRHIGINVLRWATTCLESRA